MEIQEIKLELFANHFQFYLQDEKAKRDFGNKWTKETAKMRLATMKGVVAIVTATTVNVLVTIKIFDEAPAFLLDQKNTFEKINECDLEVVSEKIVVLGFTDYFPDAKRIELENGIYKVRIYYGNPDKISENGLEGEDFYEIHLWLKT